MHNIIGTTDHKGKKQAKIFLIFLYFPRQLASQIPGVGVLKIMTVQVSSQQFIVLVCDGERKSMYQSSFWNCPFSFLASKSFFSEREGISIQSSSKVFHLYHLTCRKAKLTDFLDFEVSFDNELPFVLRLVFHKSSLIDLLSLAII